MIHVRLILITDFSIRNVYIVGYRFLSVFKYVTDDKNRIAVINHSRYHIVFSIIIL